MTVVTPGVSLARMPFVATDTIPPSWISANQRLVDVGSIAGVSRLLCGDGAAPPSNSLGGAIALVSRGGCPLDAKVSRARQAGAVGMVVADNRGGDPGFSIFSGSGGTISDVDGARLRSAMAGTGGALQVHFTRELLEVPTTWAGVPTSFSAGGLTPFGHALKPDVTAPRGEHHLLDAARVRGRPVLDLGGDELLGAARRGSSRSPARAPSPAGRRSR